MKSTIVEKLDIETIRRIKLELATIESGLWTSHVISEYWGDYVHIYENVGALRHGKTCWIQIVERSLVIRLNRLDKFPVVNDIITRIAGDETILRVYWHKLEPGQSIDKHTDDEGPYFSTITHRYQIYLDIPKMTTIFIDNELKLPEDFENCILDFNARMPHEYKNNSEHDLIFLVFDTTGKLHP